jgi:2'-5' RNA ligase
MPATRHLFFALVPAPALRAALACEIVRLHGAWGGRPTAAQKLHMTLVFLDALPTPLDPALVAAARAAADTVALPAFDLLVDRADRFGRRIGWLGCSQVPGPLQRLHDTLSDALVQRRVPMRPEAAYVPHVTVLRDPRRADPHAIAPLRWPVDGFALMASAEGEYEVLGRWPLLGRDA